LNAKAKPLKRFSATLLQLGHRAKAAVRMKRALDLGRNSDRRRCAWDY
jgi:hypothetical protein